MLSEIYCDSFYKKTIAFRPGLNVVLGTNEADNSIGKSTLLLIIDFVFGGTTYSNMDDIQKNVGETDIYFKFVFDNKEYYFSRSNNTPNIVWECDKDRNKLRPISISDYTQWLDKQYGMQLCDLSFRNCVSRYMRIYGKDNYDEHHPLKSYNEEKEKDSVLACIKTFDKYKEIKESEESFHTAQEIYKAFKKAQKYNLVSSIGKRDYNNNIRLIEELRSEINKLSNDIENNLVDVDSEKTDEQIKIRNRLSKLKRDRYFINNRIKTLKGNEEYTFSKSEKDFNVLQKFFPNVNIKKIEEIELFHTQISKVFKKQATEEKLLLEQQLNELNIIIKQLEDELVELSDNPKISTVVLQKHTELVNQINKLNQENEAFSKQESLLSSKSEKENILREVKNNQLRSIEESINSLMSNINSIIYRVDAYSPTIKFNDKGGYLFYTPNDTGTGTAHKGLIIFDLAVARLTRVPVLIHDSILLKQIANETLTNILREYLECNKQVFIAFDKQNSYGQDAQSILEKNKVIELAPNGRELFGRYWGEKKRNI